jgi:hypothetical protein
MGGLILFASICVASVSEASSLDRIVFQLSGSQCGTQTTTIFSILSPLPGVRAIDLSSIPGHALVDIDTDVLSGSNLVETVRRLWQNKGACLIELMQSCISAGPVSSLSRP